MESECKNLLPQDFRKWFSLVGREECVEREGDNPPWYAKAQYLY